MLRAITCYYNPANYVSRRVNFEIFAEKLEQSNVPLTIVECIFPGQEFSLDNEKYDVIRLRSNDVLWQKERLLNVALKRLPKNTTGVIWPDADVLFDNPNWVNDLERQLEITPVIQPFERVVRLNPGFVNDSESDSVEESYNGFGYNTSTYADALTKGTFLAHGHTGFVWAARYDFLRRFGFYDYAIAGAGDDLMAHAFTGTYESPCVKKLLPNATQWKHYRDWAEKVAEVSNKVGYISGKLFHLYHGTVANRKYVQRHEDVSNLGYNPYTDLKVNTNGCWEWTNSAPRQLKEYFNEYFSERKEDEKIECHKTIL